MGKPAVRAKMPMSEAGSEPAIWQPDFARRVTGVFTSGSCARARGFTLIELMVVITLIAIATAGVSLALRDSASTALDRDAQRLATVLEAARVQSRSTGLALAWVPMPQGFAILPAQFARAAVLDGNGLAVVPWLSPGASATIVSARGTQQTSVLLGAEPMIAPTAVILSLGDRRLQVATDGLRPFRVLTTDEAGTSP
jgi:general secretion pathway protein H